ncbi:MAG: efflux RND transporter periplasmic adaptor subunit [Gammaproteobacteria bacterium]|nr:efflux RND transporter periplasmic adaptor subunit [Gammaproteobacteria bacterium]
MSRRKRLVLFSLLAVVAVVILASWLKRPKAIPVILSKVAMGEVLRTVTNTRAGTLKACRRAKLSPSIGGQIANLPVHKGDTVKAGQVLFEIWNDDLRAQLALAKDDYLATQSRAKEACVVADVAKRDAERLVKLRKQGLTSEESIDQARGQAEAKRAACQAATATVEVSRARIDVAQAALDRTRLIAPFDGIIAEVNGELGEFVTPSPIGIPTPPAIDLIDRTCLYVEAPIDEVDAPEIKVGMPANISLDAFGKTYFPGKVRQIAPYVQDVEKQARTVDIEVDFTSDKDKANMLPGYSADVEVILDTRQHTLRIPTEGLLEGNRVYVYKPSDQTISETPVKIGLSNWQYTEITDGLQAGEQIVTSIDREGLKDGAHVKLDTNSQK